MNTTAKEPELDIVFDLISSHGIIIIELKEEVVKIQRTLEFFSNAISYK